MPTKHKHEDPKITQLTVKQMRILLEEEEKKGNGDKYLISPCDIEGNSYMGVFFAPTPATELGEYFNLVESQITDRTKLICIG